MSPRLAAATATIFWGLSFIATKAALRELTPVTLIFTRFAMGVLLLAAIVAARGLPLVPPRRAWGILLGMGFVGVFVHQMLQAHGLTMTSAVNTGWLIGLIPIWSAILAALLLHERFGPAKIAGLATGFVGAALVVTQGRLSALNLLPAARGDLLVVASTLNWAIYTVMGRPVLERLDPLVATTGAMFLGWIMLVPFFLADAGWKSYAALSASGWAAVLFLGIACSGLAYLLWYSALARLETSRVAAFLYLEPLVTVIGAAVLLNEPVRPTTIAGGLLLLGGVMLVQRAKEQ